MRVLVYGAGAVGSYLGAHLALVGHEVTLLGREPLASAIATRGLRLRAAGVAECLIDHLDAVSSPADAFRQSTTYDWIAFTMKAYDTVPAIRELLAYQPDPPLVVSFQNGVGNEDSLRSAFGPEKVLAAALTSPVTMPEPGLVVEVRRGGIALATDAPGAAAVAQALQRTALPVSLVSNGNSLKWSKLLVNLAGNAVPAILDMLPSEVFRDPALFGVELAALREALWIMRLKGLAPQNLPGIPAKTLSALVRRFPAPLLRLLLTRRIEAGRGGKLPSLLEALRAGQRRTEIAWLNGAIAQAANSLRRLAPINHALALIVSDIAAGRTPWDVYRQKPDMLLTAVRAAQGHPDYPGFIGHG